MVNLKKIIMVVGLGLAVIGGGGWVMSLTSEAAGCNAQVNIVACGTPNHASLKSAYYGSGEIQAIYNYFKITSEMVNGARMYEGTVDARNNTVVLANGNVAATNAQTIQRVHINKKAPNSYINIAGKNYPSWYTSDSYVTKVHSAFVWLDANDRFIAAIDKNCGNPVWGTPTKPAEPPKPQPQPELTCDVLEKVVLSRNSFRFSTKATAKNGATVTSYDYNFGDGTSVKGAGATVEHTYKAAGKYTVTVTVNGNANGAVSKTSEGCKMVVEVQPEPTMQVCELKTGKIITIKKAEYDEKKHSEEFKDCDDLEVCDLNSGEIVTIKKSQYDEKKHSKNYSDCEQQVCLISTKEIVTVKKSELKQHADKYTTDMSKCNTESTPETPETPAPTPTELPRTGNGDILMQFVGLSGLVMSSVAYVLSRRQA